MTVLKTITEGLLPRILPSVLPLRHRYVLTKGGKVRLRYVLSSVCGVAALSLAVMMGFSPSSQAVNAVASAGIYGPYVEEMGREDMVANRITQASLVPDETPSISEKARNLVQTILPVDTVRAPIPAQRPKLTYRNVSIGRGDTLGGALIKAGLSSNESYKAVQALSKHYDPRDLRPGQRINARFVQGEKGADDWDFESLKMDVDPLNYVMVKRDIDGDLYKSSMNKVDVKKSLQTARAQIQTSLYGSAEKAGVPVPVIGNIIHIYSWDVDFQRDIRTGDFVEVMYENLETPAGEKIKTGDIIYARLKVNGEDIPVYRYALKDGGHDYFTEDGKSVRKALMKTPIDGARLSSGFGKRTHPVLGYTKMHKGVDFAAPRGTPIYAAGDGIVEKARVWSSFGNYIRIRHNESYKTAYAHLKGFASDVKEGRRVKQGQVIGYVGTTGRSTGPHLHYEVHVNGRQVNPRSLDLPQGKSLKGKELAAFKNKVNSIKNQYAALSKDDNVELAAR
jgi:murein DD-endopeptidase MepM/ murein hydrolase activator NlpD